MRNLYFKGVPEVPSQQAQQTFAEFLNIKDFEPYRGKSTSIPDFEQLKEPDKPIEFAEPEELVNRTW